MKLSAYRTKSNRTLQRLAEDLGLTSNAAGHLSRIENGAAASILLALKIEALSEGLVLADSLLAENDAKLLANHRRLNAAMRQRLPEGCDA